MSTKYHLRHDATDGWRRHCRRHFIPGFETNVDDLRHAWDGGTVNDDIKSTVGIDCSVDHFLDTSGMTHAHIDGQGASTPCRDGFSRILSRFTIDVGNATAAPSCANCSVTARPIPLAPPVTTTDFSLKRIPASSPDVIGKLALPFCYELAQRFVDTGIECRFLVAFEHCLGSSKPPSIAVASTIRQPLLVVVVV